MVILVVEVKSNFHAFKILGIGILICKSICHQEDFSRGSFFNNKNYSNIFCRKQNVICLAIVPSVSLEKHKQHLWKSLILHNFKAFLCGINISKSIGENTGARWGKCWKLTIKTLERRQFVLSLLPCLVLNLIMLFMFNFQGNISVLHA